MRIDIVTIFPDMFRGVFDFGIVGRAREAGLVELEIHDLRQWTRDRHRSTDDSPYGGGPGMVMKVEPLVEAVESLRDGDGTEPARVVLLSPRGMPMLQRTVKEFSQERRLILVAGRYEGVDERFSRVVSAQEVSIGDYVLSGGEIPAMVVVDSVVRLLPGAISDPLSAQEDSFVDGILDFPHYTRPAEFRGLNVPEVLLSGNHRAVAEWRRQRAVEDTRERRPELLSEENGIYSNQ